MQHGPVACAPLSRISSVHRDGLALFLRPTAIMQRPRPACCIDDLSTVNMAGPVSALARFLSGTRNSTRQTRTLPSASAKEKATKPETLRCIARRGLSRCIQSCCRRTGAAICSHRSQQDKSAVSNRTRLGDFLPPRPPIRPPLPKLQQHAGESEPAISNTTCTMRLGGVQVLFSSLLY
ncbi:hypothetical protein F4803DRAFT_58023 [Xylaria telfairii]|nr:hypothetical protein F4803DRAFT_58023 [Xylaria telfairii]